MATGAAGAPTSGLRLTILQYAGDYRDTLRRLAEDGGSETYQAQKLSIDYVGSLADRLESVTTITGITGETYDEVLPNGVRAIGAGFRGPPDEGALVSLVAATAPDRLLLRSPMQAVLAWAHRNRCRTLATIADSFQPGGLVARARHWRLARRLNRIDLVGNHGRNASLQLRDIGVDAARVVPWDWPPSRTPAELSPKAAPGPERPFALFYAGAITRAKGVEDLVAAVAKLRTEGRAVQLALAGRDHDGTIARLIAESGAADGIRLLGLVPNGEVFAMMRAADAVVVPSHHSYPEGLPMTIYEALSARTPIIASDHPMFRENLRDGESAVVFRAGDAADLAAAVRKLSDDAALYARLSENAEAAWQRMQLPVSWTALIDRWLSDTPDDRAWLRDHSVASGRYDWAA